MDLFLSDIDSFSESSSYEDQDDTEFFYGGKANSILSSLEESIEKIDDFLSFERGFRHGDIVCSLTDPSGQMGRVINIDMIVDLENVLGRKIKEVDSKKLKKIRSLSIGDHVVNGPWLGKIEKLVDSVTVLFDDGNKCEFTTMGPEKLVLISPDLLEDSQYPYYPGQRVKIEVSSVSKSARWLCGRQKEMCDEGTVCAVDAGLVYVDWICSALIGCQVAAPPRLQDSKNLTLLSCFSHTNWQLGDWCLFLNLEEKDHTNQIFFERNSDPSFQELFVIARTKMKVDVLWQDGSQSAGLDSNMLFPVSITDAHDFWPEQFVLEKGTYDDPHAACIKKWGVVRFVDAKERTVRVKWVSFVNQEIYLLGEKMEETVSAYELVEHPDYSYCVGDVVFKFEKGKVVDHNEYRTDRFLPSIGIVVGFRDGNIVVKWANALTTEVAPHEILLVDKCEDLFASSVRNHENAEESNEEMVQRNKQPLEKEAMGLLDSNSDVKDCQKTSWDSTSFFIPKAAIGFFNSISASLFGSVCSTSESGTLHKEEVMELCNFSSLCPSLVVADLQTFSGTNTEQKEEETQNSKELLFLECSSNQPELFRQFDVVSDCSDHHFVDGTGKNLTSFQVKGGWLKKVQQEWSILKKDLPETIYVCVYEERMDLMRAAIIGAAGTPYHDGLFIFDISLPPEYPHKPPLVHYNSSGLRLNPNLYESGKVCLSLLNTWTGTGSEVWNPERSTILQLLLSLQALVLNEKPYFNEAGYDEQLGRVEGEKNSVSYNENAFIVSCKSMMCLIRKPPKHFETLVEEHFKRHRKYILLSCKEYMEGVPVGGCAFGERKSDDDDDEKGRRRSSSSSTGFKIMLAKFYPKLVEAFSDKGDDCSHFVEP